MSWSIDISLLVSFYLSFPFPYVPLHHSFFPSCFSLSCSKHTCTKNWETHMHMDGAIWGDRIRLHCLCTSPSSPSSFLPLLSSSFSLNLYLSNPLLTHFCLSFSHLSSISAPRSPAWSGKAHHPFHTRLCVISEPAQTGPALDLLLLCQV